MRVVQIINRETGVVSSTVDVTGWSAHKFNRMPATHGLAVWERVYNPERGDDPTPAEWLAD